LYENCHTKTIRKYLGKIKIQNPLEDEDDSDDDYAHSGSQIVMFGKYRGKQITFEEVYETDRKYCSWVASVDLTQTKLNPPFGVFQTYVKQRHEILNCD